MHDFYFKVAIDGMDINSVVSNLQAHLVGDIDVYDMRGFELAIKYLRFFDRSENKYITTKVQIWVVSNKERFRSSITHYYALSRVVFFIRENNVKSVEDFQSIVKDLDIPMIKILNTPQELTFEFFESAIQEWLEYEYAYEE